MTLSIRLAALSVAALAAVFLAGADASPIKVRKDLMDSFGSAAKTLGKMADGSLPFDATAATSARQSLLDAPGHIAQAFGPLAVDASSKAKGTIWSNWDDFLARSQAVGTAAAALDTTSAETIATGIAAVQATCKNCHSDYRM